MLGLDLLQHIWPRVTLRLAIMDALEGQSGVNTCHHGIRQKSFCLAVIWGRKGLHEGGGLAVLGRSVWERVWQSSGAGVVAVSADLVRRANPGEKKRGYRGEKAVLGRWLLFRGEVVQAALRDIFREGVAFCGERLFGWTTGSVSVIVEADQLQKGTWEKKDQRRRGWEFEGEFLA